ncbi:hypothetical protein LOZ65_004409 [Ophidiomyces ophidiicola]|nr:hypothetical protein LOZ65_004409 [Ophidiomyces ophidiicola]
MGETSTLASSRPTLSPEQLQKYIEHIYQCEPQQGELHLQRLRELMQTNPLHALTQLKQHHLAGIPFSNLVLHYSSHHTISLDPDVLFHKIVERGLGGYCVETTGLLAIVLRTLGFNFYTSAARVNKSFEQGVDTGDYHGWGHMILIVKIESEKYVVDVGFGPGGSTQPLLLRHGASCKKIGPAESRMVQENISANTDAEQKPWIFQTRTDAHAKWESLYCFYEVEFLPGDYEVMNYATSQNSRSVFTKSFICAAFILNEEKDDIVGNLCIVKATVKRNLNGNLEILQTLKNEGERVNALRTFFNIHLQPLEIRGIHGKITELKEITPTPF